MSFIEMPLDEAVEKEIVPEGEYELRVDGYTVIDEPGKAKRLSIRHTIMGEPNARTVFHNMMLEMSDDPEKKNFQLLLNKAYLELFNIPSKGSGFELDELPGSTATCFLTQSEYNDVVSNQIKLTV